MNNQFLIQNKHEENMKIIALHEIKQQSTVTATLNGANFKWNALS